jgi:tetratricopeptide (TPR) repeat protein
MNTNPLSPAAAEVMDVIALHEEGLHYARQGRFDEAAERFARVVKLDPNRVEAARHLAQAYTDGGQYVEAEAAWERYLVAKPEAAEAYRNLSNVRRRLEKWDAAIDAIQRGIELDGTSPIFHVEHSIALAKAHRQLEAKRALERAIELDANCYDAYVNLGILHQEMKESTQALAAIRRAIEIRPDDPSGLNNLSVMLSEQGKYAEAIESFESLIAKHPTYFMAWNNKGNALRSIGRVEEARDALLKALEIKPDYTEAYNNLGVVYTQLERANEACRAFDRALLLRPEYPEARSNRGLIELLMGDFRQGWADYEWRWHTGSGNKRRQYAGRAWDGSPLRGKRILLHFEQGLGDTFQFIRYARELKARGATVILECQQSTRAILSRTPGIDEFVIRGERAPAFDFYAPLLSLPGLCQTNLDNLPRRVPYIQADPEMVDAWRQRISGLQGLRVGIVWQGNPEHKGDRYRSIALRSFAPLAAIEGVTLVTLQKGFGSEQIEQPDGRFLLKDFSGIAEEDDGWLRTSAIIANLDLVISADTSVAHLAGAMGVPVWVAISRAPDWRWLLEREDTPWYPTMRLFRQDKAGDWDDVMRRVADALRQRLSVSNRSSRESSSESDQLEAQRLLGAVGEPLSKMDLAKALELLRRAADLDPTNAEIQQDLGVTYARLGRLRDGIACFRRGLELSPDSPGLYANLGLACYQSGYIEEAVSHLRKAIWLGAGSAQTHKNLGLALMALPDPAGAEECYWAALRLKPDDAEAHYRLSQAQLTQGKFEQGWLEHEWRWRWLNRQARRTSRPRWSGQNLAGKRIIILCEDDMRDTIQHARYADLLAQQGAKVVIECQAPLRRVLSGCLGVEAVVAQGQQLPDHDFHASLLSLPATLRTTLPTLPAARPYLGVESEAVAYWKERLRDCAPMRVGFCLPPDQYQRRTGALPLTVKSILRHIKPHPRSILLDLTSLIDTQRKSIVIFSVGTTNTLPAMELRSSATHDHWVEVSAVLRNLDLLVSTDHVIAHLAGAMGLPLWIPLPLCPEPRWMLHREDSPWYPTARLWRQNQRDSWDDVAIRIGAGFEQISRHAR